ncbi:MAG: hypothetical protein HZA16_08445 [Nitrospirae bacterium]|nr:hypothetical protein [Nitrospirota bacterium]
MKNLTRKIEDLFMEITFAEEPGTNHLKNSSGRFSDWLNDIFTAITFAEAGEFETARNVMGGGHGDGRNAVEYCLHGVCEGMA